MIHPSLPSLANPLLSEEFAPPSGRASLLDVSPRDVQAAISSIQQRIDAVEEPSEFAPPYDDTAGDRDVSASVIQHRLLAMHPALLELREAAPDRHATMFYRADAILRQRAENPQAYIQAIEIYKELEHPGWREALFVKMYVILTTNDQKAQLLERVLSEHVARGEIQFAIHIIKNLCTGINVQTALFNLGECLVSEKRHQLLPFILLEIPNRKNDFQDQPIVDEALFTFGCELLRQQQWPHFRAVLMLIPHRRAEFEMLERQHSAARSLPQVLTT